jgi:entry exclusion lipoprotein TrbK
MQKERLTRVFIVAAFMLSMLSGCDQFGSEKKVKIANPTCEDLGKITDDAEHAALLAKCPEYGRGGIKKSVPQEW